MEGSDFDYFSGNRPKPEDFPTYEPLQPEVPEKEPEPKKEPVSFWKKHKTILITFGVCVMVLIGVMLLAIIDPKFSEIDLTVSISQGGHQSGDTFFMDTDDIPITVRNHGSETASGENIQLRISGDNVVEKTIDWTGGDIASDKGRTISISIELKDQFKTFTLKVSVHYDGDYQDSDQIP
ncbi:MAG: CARDB domain-containing protein [Thermoplasmatota archaeon]